MKKAFVLIILTLILLLPVCAAPEGYFNRVPHWCFNEMAVIEQWDFVPECQTGDTFITCFSGNASFALEPSQRFEAQNTPYAAVRVRCRNGGNFGLYTTDKTEKAVIQLPASSEWSEYIIDMSQYPSWRDTSEKVFIEYDTEIDIERLGFFRTAPEAKAFLAEKNGVNKGILPPKWDFKNPETLSMWRVNGSTLTYEKGIAKFTSLGTDPQIIADLAEDRYFDAKSFPIFAFRANVKSDNSTATLFFKTTTQSSWKHVNIQYSSTDGWQECIADMRTSTSWDGNVTDVRFDVSNNTGSNDIDALVYLDKAGFFATVEEARAFLREDTANDGDGDIHIWNFKNPSDIEEWSTNGCSFTCTQNAGYLVPGSSDPYISYTANAEKGGFIDADKFKWAAVRMALKSASDKQLIGEWFYEDLADPDIIAPSHSKFTIPSENITSNDWFVYKIDLSDPASDSSERYEQYKGNDYDDQLWQGLMTKFRLDPINSSYTNYTEEIFIDTIALFETEEQLDSYFASHPAPPKPDFKAANSNITHRTDFYRKAIMANGLSWQNFMLSENSAFNDYTTINTQPSSESSRLVVMFKAEDEDLFKPIPLSYVTKSDKYPHFAASDKKGAYYLGYADAFFEDTVQHHAEEYITDIACRGIMQGTDANIFSPDMPFTRGMLITALGRMHNTDTSLYDGITSYKDTAENEYYAPYLDWAEENGINVAFTDESFLSEKPVTRSDVALTLKKYLEVYNYGIREYSNISPVSDIASLSDAAEIAIVKMLDLGVMSEQDEKLFDHSAIMTRADGAQIFARLIRVILGVEGYDGYDSEYYSKPRIKIAAWSGINDFEFTEDFFRSYADCGFNWLIAGMGWDKGFLFNMADKYGVQIIARDIPVFNTSKGTVDYNRIRSYTDRDSWFGNYITDEPGTDNYDALATVANMYYEETGKIPFVNLLPMYASKAQLKYGAGTDLSLGSYSGLEERTEIYRDYCQQFVDKFNAPYICTDIYPLSWSDGQKTTMNNYLEYINIIADVARDSECEFYCCFQTFGWNEAKRTPNSQEYRWQIYSLLSFGCTGLMAWNYAGYTDFPSIVNVKNYTNTQAYYDLKPVLKEVNMISDIFMQYKNLGAFNHNYGKVQSTENSHYLYISDQYTDFDAITDITCDDLLLFGCFEKKIGAGKAFTVVNMSEIADEKTVTLTFRADNYNTVTAYPMGVKTVLTPQSGVYTLTLECGQGVFVTLD